MCHPWQTCYHHAKRYSTGEAHSWGEGMMRCLAHLGGWMVREGGGEGGMEECQERDRTKWWC